LDFAPICLSTRIITWRLSQFTGHPSDWSDPNGTPFQGDQWISNQYLRLHGSSLYFLESKPKNFLLEPTPIYDAFLATHVLNDHPMGIYSSRQIKY
jgi:hypothetical protein